VPRIGTLPLQLSGLKGSPSRDHVGLIPTDPISGRQVPTFRTEARVRLAPPKCRTPSGQSAGTSQTDPETGYQPRFWCRLFPFDISSDGLLPFAFLTLTCHIHCGFSAMLTTPALNRRRLRWFAASPCRAAAEGLPPSSVRLRFERVLYLNTSFSVRGARYPWKSSPPKERLCGVPYMQGP
jgi:hypothetical protein